MSQARNARVLEAFRLVVRNTFKPSGLIGCFCNLAMQIDEAHAACLSSVVGLLTACGCVIPDFMLDEPCSTSVAKFQRQSAPIEVLIGQALDKGKLSHSYAGKHICLAVTQFSVFCSIGVEMRHEQDAVAEHIGTHIACAACISWL